MQDDLIRGHNPFWHSSLFNAVYLTCDVAQKHPDHWTDEENQNFSVFLNQFINLCVELKGEDFDSWTERRTINRLIKPVLRLLGFANKCSPTQEPWVEDESFTRKTGGETETLKPDLIIVNDRKRTIHTIVDAFKNPLPKISGPSQLNP